MDAVIVDNISKTFRIYHHRADSLKEKILARESYEEFWGLKDINLKIKKGETVGIIGANGSGKSTLLKLIAGILRPNAGRILIRGKIAALLELGAGFQGELTGRENIYLNGAILGLSKKEIDKKYDEIVAFSGLEDFIDNQVKNYSSGMYMRLGFAVAVNVEPDVLVVDEVLAVGDESFQEKCLDKIKSFRADGRTIIYVTHDLETVKQICENAVLLEKGQITARGKPNLVVSKYQASLLSEKGDKEWGTRDIEIKNVVLVDKNNRKKQVFQSGEQMIIKIEYEARSAIKDPVFGISVFDKRDNNYFGINTELNKFSTGTVSGVGAIEFQVDSLNLPGGKYSMTVAIHSRDHQVQYHWQDRLYAFVVEDPFGSVGLVHIPGMWRFAGTRV